jgi:thiol:disulfide interchange protein DsbC
MDRAVIKLRYCLSLLILSLAACAPPAPEAGKQQAAAERIDLAPASAGDIEAVRTAIKAHVPDLDPEHVRATPLPGIYEIQIGMNFGYVTADGRYLIAGDLTDLQTRKEITEDSRRVARATLVSNLEKDGFIEFAPEATKAKYTVTVFTDIDCGFCRRLHSHIKEYNEQGIAVRYVFFPRSGADTDSFYKAEQVWCSADQKSALTQAKLGAPITGDRSCKNPVAEQLQAAGDLGLRGTPSIILANGDLVPGYRQPAELLKLLQASEATPTG